jgi:hypothetical protein
VVAAGAVLGLGLAYAAGRVLASLFPDLKPADPALLSLATLVLGAGPLRGLGGAGEDPARRVRLTSSRARRVLIYMTDNGTAGAPVFNSGLRERKTQLYEGGHRVPGFVRRPPENAGPRSARKS